MLYRWKLSATHTECVCASCLQCSIPGAAFCFSPNHTDCSCPMEPLLLPYMPVVTQQHAIATYSVSECSCFLSKPSHIRQQVNHMHLLYFRILTFHLSLLIGAHLTSYNGGQSNGGWKSDRGKGFVGCVRQCNLAARRYSTVRRHSETESGQYTGNIYSSIYSEVADGERYESECDGGEQVRFSISGQQVLCRNTAAPLLKATEYTSFQSPFLGYFLWAFVC